MSIPPLSLSSDSGVLRRILTLAKDLVQSTSSCATAHRTPRSIASDPLRTDIFPTPSTPMSELLAAGLDLPAAKKFSQSYLRAAAHLKSACELNFSRSSQVVFLRDNTHPADPVKSHGLLQKVYTLRYNAVLKYWIDIITKNFVPRVLKAREIASQTASMRNRRPFNHRAIPLMEQSFQQNAYPSRSDRLALAAQSGMEYKQISVWFQNRRSRCKGSGEELKANSTLANIPPELEDALAEILAEADYVLTEGTLDPADNIAAATRLDTDVVFNLQAPVHAFPATYPPACSYRPFPIEPRERQFHTPWMRSCSSSCRQNRASVNIREVTNLFAELKLFDGASSVDDLVHGNVERAGGAASSPSVPLVGFATVATRAPLPALVPTTMVTGPSSTFNPRIASSAQISESSHHQSRSGFSDRASMRTTLMEERLVKGTSGRKVAGLSKCPPLTPGVKHRVSPYPAVSRTPLSISHHINSDSHSDDGVACTTKDVSITPSTSRTSPRSCSASTSKVDPLISMQPISCPASSPRRKTRPLHKCSNVPHIIPPTTSRFSHTPYARSVSRSGSISSLYSESSSSSSEVETPPSTPELLPAHLPPLESSRDPFTWDYPSSDNIYNILPLDDLAPVHDAHVDRSSSITYVQSEAQKERTPYLNNHLQFSLAGGVTYI